MPLWGRAPIRRRPSADRLDWTGLDWRGCTYHGVRVYWCVSRIIAYHRISPPFFGKNVFFVDLSFEKVFQKKNVEALFCLDVFFRVCSREGVSERPRWGVG